MTREEMMGMLRREISECGRTRSMLAVRAGVNVSTIHAIATRRTKWPRPETMFSLCEVLGLEMRLVQRDAAAVGSRKVVEFVGRAAM